MTGVTSWALPISVWEIFDDLCGGVVGFSHPLLVLHELIDLRGFSVLNFGE